MIEGKRLSDIEVLKKKYGFNKADYKYIPAGGEILNYVGIEVVFVEFTKKPGDNNWVNVMKPAIIDEFTDYDPMTLTYNCKYRILGEDKDTETREVRVIPEGFSFNNGDAEGWMCRFIPMSIHHKLMEDEAIHNREVILYAKRDTLPIDALKTLSDNKEQGKVLRYSCNVKAVIKLTDNTIVSFRIMKLSLRHDYKDTYNLKLEDEKGVSYSLKINSDQKEYNFIPASKNQAGFLKIIDIR